jgi:uncharacterized protein
MPKSLFCPVCSRKLKQRTVAGVVVDVCHGGCGGLWFDNFELQKFDEPHEDEGGALLNIPFDPGLRIDHRRRRACPECRDVPLRRHFYSRNKQVEVDSCPSCGGYWLDCGELARIRREAKDAKELQRLAHAYALSTAQPKLKELRTEGRAEAQQATLTRRLFAFVGIH